MRDESFRYDCRLQVKAQEGGQRVLKDGVSGGSIRDSGLTEVIAPVPLVGAVATARHPLHPLSGVAAVFLCGMFAFIDLYATQPILPLLESLYHSSKAAVGLTISASTLGVAVSAPILGVLTERLNRKWVIVWAVVALTVPTLLAASSSGLHSLIFWRLLQGLVTPGIFATTIAYITEQWPPTAVAPVMSIYVSGTALGGFLGRTIMGLLAGQLGWRGSFLVLGVMTGVGALVITKLLPSAPYAPAVRVTTDVGVTSLREHLALMLRHFCNPRLLATYAIGFNVLFSLVGVFTYITFYLAAPPFSLSTEWLSLLFVVYLVGLVATPLAGALLPRIGLRRGIAGSVSLSLAGVLITLSHSLPVVIAGLALCCTGVFISQACATSFLRVAAPPDARAAAVGLYVMCYYIGGTVAGVFPSYLWKWGRWPACVALIALVDVASIVIATRGWRMPKEVVSETA
ncbi:MAG: MFS transporter [Acidobacteriaceae bacterium]